MVQLTNTVKKPLFPHFSLRLARLTQWAGPYATVLQMLLIGLIVLSLSRIGLIIWQWERVNVTGILVDMLVQGMRADLILLGYFVVIPVLLAPFFAHKFALSFWRSFNLCWATFALFAVIFLELSKIHLNNLSNCSSYQKMRSRRSPLDWMNR